MKKLFCSGMTFIAAAAALVALAFVTDGVLGYILLAWYLIFSTAAAAMFVLANCPEGPVFLRIFGKYAGKIGIAIIAVFAHYPLLIVITTAPTRRISATSFSVWDIFFFLFLEVGLGLLPLALGFAIHQKVTYGRFVVCPVKPPPA